MTTWKELEKYIIKPASQPSSKSAAAAHAMTLDVKRRNAERLKQQQAMAKSPAARAAYRAGENPENLSFQERSLLDAIYQNRFGQADQGSMQEYLSRIQALVGAGTQMLNDTQKLTDDQRRATANLGGWMSNIEASAQYQGMTVDDYLAANPQLKAEQDRLFSASGLESMPTMEQLQQSVQKAEAGSKYSAQKTFQENQRLLDEYIYQSNQLDVWNKNIQTSAEMANMSVDEWLAMNPWAVEERDRLAALTGEGTQGKALYDRVQAGGSLSPELTQMHEDNLAAYQGTPSKLDSDWAEELLASGRNAEWLQLWNEEYSAKQQQYNELKELVQHASLGGADKSARETAERQLQQAEDELNQLQYVWVMGKPDYPERSQPNTALYETDSQYRAVNDPAYAQQLAYEDAYNGITPTVHHLGYLMDDRDRGMYNYLYEDQGKSVAEAYLSGIYNRLKYAYAQEEAQGMQEFATAHPILANAASVLEKVSPQRLGQTAVQVGAAVTGADLSPYDTAFQIDRTSGTIRGTTLQNIDSNIGDFLYSTGMSIADNLAAMLAGGGATALSASGKAASTVSGLLMAANGFGAQTYDVLSRGADLQDASNAGAISAVTEFITERMGFDNILKGWMAGSVGDYSQLMTQFVKGFATGAAEETPGNFIDAMVDDWLMGDESTRQLRITELAGSMPLEDAMAQADKEFLADTVKEILAGGLAEGVMGSASYGTNAYLTGQQLKRQNLDEELMEIAQQMPEGSKSRRAAEAAKRTKSKMSTATLYNALHEEMPSQSREVLDNISAAQMARQLKKDGETGDATAIAKGVLKVLRGETLTEEESQAIAQSSKGVEMMDRMSRTDERDRAEIRAYNEAYNAGYYGQEATSGMRQAYYQAGVEAAQQAEQKRLNRVGKVGLKDGGVSYIGAAMTDADVRLQNTRALDQATMARLNQQQRDTVYALRIVSKVTGIRFALYEGQADASGNITVENGKFDSATNTIFLDLNSGKNRADQGVVNYAVLRTAAHEMTHFIEKNSPEGYASLKSFIQSELTARGQDMGALVRSKQEMAERQGRMLTREAAVAEVVADACEMMLQDTQAIHRLAQKDKSLFGKIKRFLNQLMDKIRKALEGVDATHTEARALREAGKYIEGLQQLWDNALVEAVETARSVQPEQESVEPSEQFELRAPVEQRKDGLVAVHNLSAAKLQDTLKLGGFPMPSIAVIKAQQGHDMYGAYSVVFGPETIDPKANRANRVYGNDAWTPVFPPVETEIDGNAMYKLEMEIEAAAQKVDPEFGKKSRMFFGNFGGSDVTGKTIEDLSFSAWNNAGMLAAYLTEQGETVNVLETQVDEERGYKPEKAEQYDKILDIVDALDYANMPMHELLNKYGDQLAEVSGQLRRLNAYWKTEDRRAGASMARIIREAIAYEGSGRDVSEKKRTVKDYYATENAMKEMADRDAFNRWFEAKMSGVFGRKGIYNGKDRFTPSGNRRTFKQTHYDYTVENVVRAMLQEEESNIPAVNANGLKAAASTRYGSLDEIRADSYRLGKVSDEEFNARMAKADSDLHDFFNAIEAWDYDVEEQAGELLVTASKRKLDAAGIAQLFKANGFKKTTLRAAKIAESVIRQVQTIPTGYLEAKPARVVSFDEIRMVVAPDDIPAKLASALDERGIPYTTYDGSTEDRLAKLNGVEDVQFSLREADGRQVVWVNENILDGMPSEQNVANYIKKYLAEHIGEVYTIIESGSKVYLGKALPKEYTFSREARRLRYGQGDLYDAKMKMVPGIGEMIEIATGRRWEKTKHTHNKDAKYGIYKYTSHIAFPSAKGVDAYTVELVILNSSDGKKYLYDVHNIKKDSTLAQHLYFKVRGGSVKATQQDRAVSDTSIPQPSAFDNPSEEEKFSLRETAEEDLTREYLESMAPTESMTETEKWLLGKYQSTLAEMREKQAAAEQQDELARTATSDDDRIKAQNRAKVFRTQANRLQNTLRSMEKTDGFGNLMRTSERVIKRFMESEGTMRAMDASDNLTAQMADVQRQLQSVAQRLRTAEAGQRAAFARGLFDQKALNAAGNNVRKAFNSSMSGKAIADRLALAYAELYASEGEDASQRFTQALRSLAEDVLHTSSNRYRSPVLDDLRENLGGSISLSEAQKQELKSAGISMSQFRRVVGSVVNVSENGSSLSSIVSSAEYYGSGIIAQLSSADSEGDMVMKLYELVLEEKAKERSDALEGMSEAESLSYTMAEIMQQANFPLTDNTANVEAMREALLEGAERNQTIAAKVDAAITTAANAKKRAGELWRNVANVERTAREAVAYYRALDEQRRLMEEQEIIQHLKSDAARKLREAQTIKELSHKSAGKVNHIKNVVRRLHSLRAQETDYKNIPEDLKAFVGDVVTLFGNNFGSTVWSHEQADKVVSLYTKLNNANGPYAEIAPFYDEDMLDTLQALSEWAKKYEQLSHGKGMTRLERAQLRFLMNEAVADLVDHVNAIVRNSRDIFNAGRKQQFAQISAEVRDELLEREDKQVLLGTAGDTLKWMDNLIRTGNITPVYFFDQLGNEALKSLFNDFRLGQEEYAFDLATAREAIQRYKEQYHYDAWKDAEELTFKTAQGHTIMLTKEQALWLYATWKRERSNEIAATEHLTRGGFVYESKADPARAGKGLKTGTLNTTGHLIADSDMAVVDGYLTQEQKDYADAMVGYLSNDMAELGNRVSMEMFGIRKYKEKYYFPYQTVKDQLNQKSTAGATATTDDSRIKHSGFTHRLTAKARTAVVMGDFSEVVANHISQMVTYSSFVLPIENMNRVLNHKFETEDGSQTTIRSMIRQKYGENALKYIETFIRDMNGGARSESRSNLGKMVGLHKKAMVAASLSVALQQPSSILRAAVMMNPKYLMKAVGSKLDYEQLKRFSGVAIIKQMGRFDTNVGKSNTEWMLEADAGSLSVWQKAKQALNPKEWEQFKDRWSAIVTGLPSKADEWSWAALWNAVKREQADLHKGMDTNSEEFLMLCGDRFNDIVDHTQVYDSLLAKSQIMRSSSDIDKMMTSFASEPTLTLNIMYDAFANKNHPDQKKRIWSAMLYTTLSSLAAAIGSAMISAWNKDDDDRTAWEKLLNKTVDAFIGNVNPLENIPYVRDVWSLFQGYEVERTDMSLFSDLVAAVNKVKSDNYTGFRKVEEMAGSIANVFGIPVKNVMRDMRRIYNAALSDWGKPTDVGIENAWKSALDDAFPFADWYENKKEDFAYRAVNAYRTGDKATAEDIIEYLSTVQGTKDKDIRTAMKSAVKDMYLAGGISREDGIKALLTAYPDAFNANDLYWNFDEWDAEKAGEISEGESYSKYLDFYRAVETGTNLKAEIQRYLDTGVKKETLSNMITNHYKPQMTALYKTNKAEASNLQARLLTAYTALGYDREKKLKDIKKWYE